MYKKGQVLFILDKEQRLSAPIGRGELTITSDFIKSGCYPITYADGTEDYMMISLLVQHWGPWYAVSPLWQAMNRE